MPLAAGDRLGPYEIVAPIGAGGMGEVYKARDPRLGRDVALKILPPEVAADPSRRQRFEQEARAVAALNHPNIVAVYDVGDNYMVTELIDGESLRGAKFGLRKTIDIAAQIAGGLAAAHQAGIVHRDLKPDNILLTSDGRVKILDFGLAKTSSSTAPAANTETMTVHTEPGVVMGTAGYMSPEQVRGKPADHRSDIFSFGVVLYELLAGARAFHGDTSVESMSAILKQDPPELPETLPPTLRHIVTHCLEKDPSNRFQSAKDLAFALTQTSSTSSSNPAFAPRRVWPWRGAALIVAAIAGLLGGFFVWRRPAPLLWTGVMLGGTDVATYPRPSPDGNTIAFIATLGGFPQVGLLKPETGNTAILTHSMENGYVTSLGWSADGSRIYYDRWTDAPRGIYSVPVLGGDEQPLLEGAGYPDALPDGSLLVIRPNQARQWQAFHFWPDTGRIQPLPLIFSTSSYPLAIRSLPGGRDAVAMGIALPASKESGQHLYMIHLESGTLRRLNSGIDDNLLLSTIAITRDGRDVLATAQTGGLIRVFSIPLSNNADGQDLLRLTNQIFSIDTGPGGSVYLDQIERSVVLIRFSASGGHVQKIATFAPGIVTQRSGQIPPEPMTVISDGRVVVEQVSGGHSRLVAVEEGRPPVQLVNTSEETASPLAAAGPGAVAFLLGREPRRTIGVAAVSSGRITRRIPFDHGSITSLAATPDGKTIFCAAGGTVWAIPQSGEAKKIRAGDQVAVDPAGKYLVVEIIADLARFVRVPLDGGAEYEIPITGSLRAASYISANAIAPDGRILTPLGSSTWNWPAGILSPAGVYSRITLDLDTDFHALSWTPDGRIIGMGLGMQSTLWKFQQELK